jgi:hypothetical protein
VVARNFTNELLVGREVVLRDLLIGRTSVGSVFWLGSVKVVATSSLVLAAGDVNITVNTINTGGSIQLCGGSLLDLKRGVNHGIGGDDLSIVGDRDGDVGGRDGANNGVGRDVGLGILDRSLLEVV